MLLGFLSFINYSVGKNTNLRKRFTSIMNIGIIGSGNITSSVHLPLLSCMDKVNIKFIADRKNPKILAKLYNTKSIELNEQSSFPDCDIILITLPVGVRKNYLQKFAEYGSYIFSEKPFTMDLKTHEDLLQLSDKFTCNYERIFYNTTRNIKNIISSEIFGKIQKISIVEGGIQGKTGITKNSYINDPKLSGGFLHESASHTFNQLIFLFENITVNSANILWQDNFDIESNVFFDVTGKNSFPIDYKGTHIKHVQSKTSIFFERTKIEFNHLIPDSTFLISTLNSAKKFILNQENTFASTFPQAYYLKWNDFINKIYSSSKLNPEFETSLPTTRIISDILEKGGRK